MVKYVHVTNVFGYIHIMAVHRDLLHQKIYPPSQKYLLKVLNLKNQINITHRGIEWCWLCGSHGGEEICPRKDEIDTEFGHQRLKELLQQVVKAEGKLGKGTEITDKIPGVEEEINILGTPPFSVPDKNPVCPQLIQPPDRKKPYVKPIEVADGPQWPSKPSTSTPVRGTGGTKGQPPGKPTKGIPSTGRGKGNGNQGED